MTKKYGEIEFDLTENSYCCGIFDLGLFFEASTGLFYNRGVFTSKSAQFIHFEQDWIEVLIDRIGGDNRRSGGYLTQASVTPTYQKDFYEYFLATGWDVVNEFQNTNTGNVVVVLNRFISKEELSMYEAQFGDNEDQDDRYSRW